MHQSPKTHKQVNTYFCRIPDKATKSEDSMGSGPRDDDSADSSPHRSVSAAEEETDSELEEESSIKPRGTLLFSRNSDL